jgi:hypothetical protein
MSRSACATAPPVPLHPVNCTTHSSAHGMRHATPCNPTGMSPAADTLAQPVGSTTKQRAHAPLLPAHHSTMTTCVIPPCHPSQWAGYVWGITQEGRWHTRPAALQPCPDTAAPQHGAAHSRLPTTARPGGRVTQVCTPCRTCWHSNDPPLLHLGHAATAGSSCRANTSNCPAAPSQPATAAPAAV